MALEISEFNERVQQWISERWPAGGMCPMCKTMSGWQLAPPAEVAIRPDVVENTAARQAMVLITLTCNKCAYVVSLNAVTMGIVLAEDTFNAPRASA